MLQTVDQQHNFDWTHFIPKIKLLTCCNLSFKNKVDNEYCLKKNVIHDSGIAIPLFCQILAANINSNKEMIYTHPQNM